MQDARVLFYIAIILYNYHVNEQELIEYARLYSPYAKNASWIKWFVETAPLKAQRTLNILKKYKNMPSKLLDCGCGIGFQLFYLSNYYKHSIGVDVDPYAVKTAKKQLEKLNKKVLIKQYHGKRLPFPDRTFDLVTSLEVWEHAVNPQLMLKEIARVLKPDGIIFITTANRLWPIEPHYKLPFLSYLPSPISDWYVQRMKKAEDYHDIHLPTYSQFKKSVEEFFVVEDITIDSIIDYKKLRLGKERGFLVVAAAKPLSFLRNHRSIPIIYKLSIIIEKLLSHFLLGWFFIGRIKQ